MSKQQIAELEEEIRKLKQDLGIRTFQVRTWETAYARLESLYEALREQLRLTQRLFEMGVERGRDKANG